MALNDQQILSLLNDGYDIDIDILDENDDQKDELENTFTKFRKRRFARVFRDTL